MKSYQQEIYKNLLKLPKGKKLADLYLPDLYAGAVRLVEDESLQGRISLVCHALREIINKLPVIVGVEVKQRANFENDIKPVIEEWNKEGMFATVDSVINKGNGQERILIPAPLHLMIITSKLLREQQGVDEENERKTKSMIFHLIPEWKERLQIAIPFIKEWKNLGRWFVGVSHGRAVNYDEMETKFEEFEQMLSSLLGNYLDSLKDIERIVTEANE